MSALQVQNQVVDQDKVRLLYESFLQGKSANTIQAYKEDFNDFCSFLEAENEQQGLKTFIENGHTEAHVMALKYKQSLLDKGLAPSTINRRLSALRSMIRLARTLGLIAWTLEIGNEKSETYRDTRGPGRDGFQSMLDHLRNPEKESQKASGLRDHAICRCLHDMGLRVSELCGINWPEDVDLSGRRLQIVGKGKREKQLITLPQPTAKAIMEWLDHRGKDKGPLFIRLDRGGKATELKPLNRSSVWRMIKRVGREVGLETWPHGLRHLGVTTALDETGGNIREVQKFSRHADVKTIERYDDNREDLAGQVAGKVAGTIK